ncbi:MAG: NAD-dependent epimerase/dehydratase family protein [Vicinamibacteria bacterium]
MDANAKVFVTGGNGFIGSRVVRRLVESGRKVRCLLRESSQTSRLEGLDFETARGDVRDLQSVRRGASGCPAIIHLASLSSWTDIASPLMPEVVVGGTTHVLEAAAEQNSRVVFVSSATAINGSTAPIVHDEQSVCTLPLERYIYPRAKIQAEALCFKAAALGREVVIVNPTEVYGPEDTGFVTSGTLVDFAKSSPAVVCDGGTSVAHVDDVAAGIVAALDRGRSGERYILGGENLSVEQLARETLTLLGRKPSIIKIPNRLLLLVTRVGVALHLPLPFNPAVVPYGTLYWYMSSAKAQGELGVTFRSPRLTLQDTLAWLRRAGHVA